jgi:hypothetical protein
MKKIFFILLIFSSTYKALSQTTAPTTGTISNLAVPASPAFSIVDITPTLVQNPTTPKAFALGIAQSFQQSGAGFPNNLSAEFAPVWWIQPKGINVYAYLGLPLPSKRDSATSVKENLFAGLKFTTLSVAFINKDLIPDTSSKTQNIFSMGMHSTVIKVFGYGHAKKLNSLIAQWHTDAQFELTANEKLIDDMSRLNPHDTDYKKQVYKLQKKYTAIKTPDDLKEINELITQKPVFAWDMSAAMAVYGLNNQTVRTGRASLWTSFSLNLPIGDVKANNYFKINALGRYLIDNFQKNDQGNIVRQDNLDTGGNLGFEFNRLSLSMESLARFVNGQSGTKNRTVGVVSVKLTDTIFINGTFGQDFAGPNKLISSFGIDWGFGKEKVSL